MIENSKAHFLDGQTLLLKKPVGWTSFDVVRKIRFLIKKKYNLKKIKIGHAGTLDPLATGLLIICTGKYTKRISSIQKQKKTYTGVITLGATTASYDLETKINNTFETKHITKKLIEKTVNKFIGEIDQKPPIFSALKQDGERLYKKARRGEKVKLKSRKVTIHSFEITSFKMPHATFKICCSKGTYIRSIAHDFGISLDSGGYLSNLSRTAIGNHLLKDALDISEFEQILNK